MSVVQQQTQEAIHGPTPHKIEQ